MFKKKYPACYIYNDQCVLYKCLIIIILFVFSIFYSKGESLEIDYYCQKVKIKYDKSICLKFIFKPDDYSLKEYYLLVSKSGYKVLLDDLEQKRIELNLNDWFYYKLVDQFSQSLFKQETDNYKKAFCWFILVKSHYNVFLTYSKQFDLYGYTKDLVYGVEEIQIKEKTYVRLNTEIKASKSYVVSKFFPSKISNFFDFSIKLPILTCDSLIRVTRKFILMKKEEIFEYSISKNYIELMNNYPKVSVEKYFNVSLSAYSVKSLIPQLKEKIKGLTLEDATRYILSYVRLSFEHKDDNYTFGYSRSMIAEEALYYGYGDCEDKSALFYVLVKELIGVPMLVLYYPNHINVAVGLDKVYGKPFTYKKKEYSVLEPSELGDTRDIGDVPTFDRYTHPTVIVEYNIK